MGVRLSGDYEQDHRLMEKEVNRLSGYLIDGAQFLDVVTPSIGPVEITTQHSLGKKPSRFFPMGGAFVSQNAQQLSRSNESIIVFEYVSGPANTTITILIG
jgi:hypothetical protein